MSWSDRLAITIPSEGSREIQYTIDVLFRCYLGLDHQVTACNTDKITIAADGKSIVLPAIFSLCAEKNWRHPITLPQQPLHLWNVETCRHVIQSSEPSIPVLYGDPAITVDEHHIVFGADVIGAVFFMLSRYEESIKTERDAHDRFPSTASLAFQEDYLHRPIVDEYLQILRCCMKWLWPQITWRKSDARTIVSCDVDEPYWPAVKSWFLTARQVAGDLVKRGDLRAAMAKTINIMATNMHDYTHDPYDTFEWMMDVHEQAGNQVTFFFITDHSGGPIDGCYSIDELRIRKLMRRIVQRGHRIGLHCSYCSYRNEAQILKEAAKLRQVMQEEHIQQDEIGSRQHFLRWNMAETPRYLEEAGLTYDSTLTYADCAGFRCGTCAEFPMYDLVNRRAMHLNERPLIIMERSIISSQYMGMGYSDRSQHLMQYYKTTCRNYRGNFTILWHNSHFLTEADRAMYVNVIQ
jgi:hypothetical protein